MPIPQWVSGNTKYIISWACPSPHPKWHVDRFSRFITARGYVQQTQNRHTDRGTILPSEHFMHALQPNKHLTV